MCRTTFLVRFKFGFKKKNKEQNWLHNIIDNNFGLLFGKIDVIDHTIIFQHDMSSVYFYFRWHMYFV